MADLFDYQVYWKNKFIGIFRCMDEEHALREAWEALGYPCNKFSSCIREEFTVLKVGIL